MTDAQVAAAAGLWATGSMLLSAGIPGGGAVTQAELLRAAHQARAVRLHHLLRHSVERVVAVGRSALLSGRAAHRDRPAASIEHSGY